MAHGKSLELRYNNPTVTEELTHHSWTTTDVLDSQGNLAYRTVERFGPPYRNPERPARKAAVLARRRAARATARANGHRA